MRVRASHLHADASDLRRSKPRDAHDARTDRRRIFSRAVGQQARRQSLPCAGARASPRNSRRTGRQTRIGASAGTPGRQIASKAPSTPHHPVLIVNTADATHVWAAGGHSLTAAVGGPGPTNRQRRPEMKNGWRTNIRIRRARLRKHAYAGLGTAGSHRCRCGSEADKDWKWECVATGTDVTLSACLTDRERKAEVRRRRAAASESVRRHKTIDARP